jgi:hypothetical protein
MRIVAFITQASVIDQILTHLHARSAPAARSPVFARPGNGAYSPRTSTKFPFSGDAKAVVDDQRRRSGHLGAVIPPFRLTRSRTS